MKVREEKRQGKKERNIMSKKTDYIPCCFLHNIGSKMR